VFPRTRVRETREAAIREANTAFAAKEAAYKSDLARIQQQLHALVGVQPPPEPEVDAVRQQFKQLFPKLAQLEERGEDIFGILDRAGDIENQNSHYWSKLRTTDYDRLFHTASESLGGRIDR